MAAALLAATLVVGAVLLSGGDDDYRVRAVFANASQLVEGNLVTVAGEKVGSVEDIDLTDDGRASVEMTVAEEYAPLRRGTRAVIRQASLSGVANRYVALQLGGARGEEIDSGGAIPSVDTVANVDLDQLFNTFDPRAREGVKGTIRFFRDLNRGREEEAREALRYVSPALASSGRLFAELDRGNGDLERFVDANARLFGDLAARDDDLAALVRDLATTLGALADERDALSTTIERAPAFLRRSNTTFANLRAALDDLDPLVEAARPVVRDDLGPLFDELRPFARDARPAIRDLSDAVRKPGEDNDLIELLGLQPAVDRIANDTATRNGRRRPGAFPASRAAARATSPQFGFLRPYAPDLVGWFDDFSHSGAYDALGGFSRAGLQLNQFTFTPTLDALAPVPLPLRDEVTFGTLDIGRNNRCPGSVERPAPDGSNPYRPGDNFPCDPAHSQNRP